MYHGVPHVDPSFLGVMTYNPYFEGLETFMVSHGFLGSKTV